MMRGRAYRHDVKQKSNNHRLKIVTAYGYKSIAGYLDGQYIKFSKNSKNQRYHKKISNKKSGILLFILKEMDTENIMNINIEFIDLKD